jgi:hypothetical protein
MLPSTAYTVQRLSGIKINLRRSAFENTECQVIRSSDNTHAVEVTDKEIFCAVNL